MTRYLAIYVKAHEGRFHGDGDDPPSPFRLFQALVAGAGISGPLDGGTRRALAWLEGLPDAPIIAAPRTVRGQSVSMFMPNNDLDAKGGDVRRMCEIRLATKVWRPRLFDPKVPWVYAWPFADGDETPAATVCALSEKLYQFGRGVDMAWAWGELLDEPMLEAQLTEYDGVVRRPSSGDGLSLACPHAGSLESLERRYQARRFRLEGGRRAFVQPRKPSCRQLGYESPPARHVFELRSATDSERRVAWPLAGASSLVVAARDSARARLSAAMPSRTDEIDRHLVGRKADGSHAGPAGSRVRIVPIPSIGMHYADRGIRQLLVEVPAACPLRSDDVRWAFSGVEPFDPETGEVLDVLLSALEDDHMLRHYGVGDKARVFRTVTPAALPEPTKRRRINPARLHEDAKPGDERLNEATRATAAVTQALRHAGVHARVDAVRVQREPFEAAGDRVEPFAEGTRFEKERLWHVEVAFGAPVAGPLLIGDGRFLGLGLMAPAPGVVSGVHAFAVVDGPDGELQPLDVARALRRAVMARVLQLPDPRANVSSFFGGHGDDGWPGRGDEGPHLTFAFDPTSRRLLVIAPHVMDRRAPARGELDHLRTLEAALEGFRELRAGTAGLLNFRSSPIGDDDPLFASSRRWQSATRYHLTRHTKDVGVAEALAAGVRAECQRRGLPSAQVTLGDVEGMPGVGLVGHVRLDFAVAVPGPLILGRKRHLGGGLLTGTDSTDR